MTDEQEGDKVTKDDGQEHAKVTGDTDEESNVRPDEREAQKERQERQAHQGQPNPAEDRDHQRSEPRRG